MLCSLLLLVPSENATAEIVPIPVDAASAEPVNEAYYLSETLYEDPSLRVEIESGEMFESSYMVARIKIADPSQLRSCMASRDGKATATGARLAQRANAVFAINGDFFKTNQPSVGKYIVRQGKLLQHNAGNRTDRNLDILIIDDRGDFHILPYGTNEDAEAFEGTIINSYCFGPGLIIDGAAATEFNDRGYGPEANAQRIAICQTGELEYMCVVCSGPDHPNSKGMTIQEFVTLLTTLGDIQNAYNLDGGTSAYMIFKEEKINNFGSTKKREINDIICFCSAWAE